jgi:hypothetical protein
VGCEIDASLTTTAGKDIQATFTCVDHDSVSGTVTLPADTPTENATFTLWYNCDRSVNEPCPNNGPPQTVWQGSIDVEIIGCGVPSITSVLPNTWFAGNSYDKVVLTGTGFTTKDKATDACPVTPVTIAAADGTAVPVSNVSVDSKTKITLTGVAPPTDLTTQLATISAGTAPNTGTFNTAQILGNQIMCSGANMQCNGNVISTNDGSAPAPQEVVVGQPIILKSLDLPTGVSATSTTWEVRGTNIGARVYAKDNSWATATPTLLTNPGLTTYWLYPKDSIPVTYRYCVTIPGVENPDDQCSPKAKAIFNVLGPKARIKASLSSESTPPATGAWWVSKSDSGCNDHQWLVFGTLTLPSSQLCFPTLDNYGIIFEAKDIENVPASGGEFQWAQIITADSLDGSAPSGTVPAYLGTGLDNFYPYPSILNTSNPNPVTGDAPATGLTDTDLTTETRTF